MNTAPRTIVVMGVSGSGKSLVGALLARRLGAVFDDADDFHPPSSISKMAAGIPLNDEDRRPWHDIVRQCIIERRAKAMTHVLACSALKEAHRDRLREGDSAADLIFVYLKGSRQMIGERLAARSGHFMPPSLLDSQFATLEEPPDAMVVDIGASPEEMVGEIIESLKAI